MVEKTLKEKIGELIAEELETDMKLSTEKEMMEQLLKDQFDDARYRIKVALLKK